MQKQRALRLRTEKTMKDTIRNRFEEFHAGRFLQESLQESGHVAWLAAKTGRTVPEIDALFAMPNMDAIIANLNKYIELLEKDRGH